MNSYLTAVLREDETGNGGLRKCTNAFQVDFRLMLTKYKGIAVLVAAFGVSQIARNYRDIRS